MKILFRRYNALAGAKLLAGAAMALYVGLPIASANAESLPERIVVGGVAPLTGGGSVLGVAISTGLRMAVEEINAKGGIAGRKVDVVMGDTQSDPTAASNETKRVILQGKANFLIGPAVSQEVVASAAVATGSKILQMTTAGTSDLTPKVAPYHFSFNWSSDVQAESMVKYAIEQLGSKTPGILTDNGGQSKTGVKALHRALEARSIKAAGEQEFPFRVEDMTPQMLSLRRSGADVILFFASTVEDTGKAGITARDIGWDVPIVGAGSVATYAATVASRYGVEALQNVVAESYPGLTYCSGSPVGTSEYGKFLTRLKDFRPDLAGKIPAATASYFYSGVYLAKLAIEATNSVDGAILANWIEKNAPSLSILQGVPDGVTGSSHFLFGPKSVVMAKEPHKLREDGLMARASC